MQLYCLSQCYYFSLKMDTGMRHFKLQHSVMKEGPGTEVSGFIFSLLKMCSVFISNYTLLGE